MRLRGVASFVLASVILADAHEVDGDLTDLKRQARSSEDVVSSATADNGRSLQALSPGRPTDAPSGMKPVFAYLIEPAGDSRLPALRGVLSQMLRGKGVRLQVWEEPPAVQCPTALPVWGPMSDEARTAWAACSVTLSMTPVTFLSPREDFDELWATLNLLSEHAGKRAYDPRFREGMHSFFLTDPASSKEEFFHGPTGVEARFHKGDVFNASFVWTLLIVILLIIVTGGLATWVYRRSLGHHRTRMGLAAGSAAALLAPISVPLAAGAAGAMAYQMHRKRNQEERTQEENEIFTADDIE